MQLRTPVKRHHTLLLAPGLLFLACLGTGTAAHADSSFSSSGAEETSVFRAKNTAVAVEGGVATAINRCITDASDGVIQQQETACTQVAVAGNLTDSGAITVYQSKNVSITVSGGTATAINQCVNDASDGVIQDQKNACDQAATAGNVVLVESISISASKNVTITVTGGSATAINECVNNASNAESQSQENACIQVANAGSTVDVGDINVRLSKNIMIDITGGLSMEINSCLSHASNSAVATRSDTCTKVGNVGNSTTVGRIDIYDSKNVTIQVDGKTVYTIRKSGVQPSALVA